MFDVWLRAAEILGTAEEVTPCLEPQNVEQGISKVEGKRLLRGHWTSLVRYWIFDFPANGMTYLIVIEVNSRFSC